MKTYEVANITFMDGTLKVDLGRTSVEGKHYNVSIEELPDGKVHITAEKPRWTFNWGDISNTYLILALDDYIVEYRPFLWSRKTKKKLREGWIELKTRDKRSYTTRNWIMITEEKE